MLRNRYRNPQKLVPVGTSEDRHKRVREALNLPADAVIHSLRRSFGTR